MPRSPDPPSAHRFRAGLNALRAKVRALAPSPAPLGPPGLYFVTVCCHHKQCILGEGTEAGIQLNELGQLVEAAWLALSAPAQGVQIGAYVVMPNHLHGILAIAASPRSLPATPLAAARDEDLDAWLSACQAAPCPGDTLAPLIDPFKAQTHAAIVAQRGTPEGHVWQAGFVERRIHTRDEWLSARAHIHLNARRWPQDPLYPT